MGREYSSSIYSGASGVWDGSTAVLYIVEHLECGTGVQQFYIEWSIWSEGREYSSSIYSGASGVWDGSTAVLYIVEHLECGTGVQQFYI